LQNQEKIDRILGMNTLDPTCKICENKLNSGGLFPTSLDPFYLLVENKRDRDNFITVNYHTILEFFLVEVSDSKENIVSQTFYHTECAPNDLTILLPTKEVIEKYLFSGNVHEDLQVQLSIKKAQKSRIHGINRNLKT